MENNIINQNDGPSLTLYEDFPCFVMPDGEIKISKAPQLFNTEGGVIGFANDFMAKLQELYSSEEEMRQHAAQKIQEYGLLDIPNSDSYSIWLLVAMTID